MGLQEFKTSLAEMICMYQLPRATILDTIEKTMSEVLASRYRSEEIQVRIDDVNQQVSILAFSMLNGGTWREIPESRLSGIKNLHRHIQSALEKACVVREVKKIRPYCNQIHQGTVTQITRDGSLYVEIELLPGQPAVTGFCPTHNLAASERGRFFCGDKRYFYLSSCAPVMVGRVARTRLILDRRTKKLPQMLLTQWFENPPQGLRITCRARRPGLRSEIWTTHKIPRNTLEAVRAELSEQLFVLIGKNGVEIRDVRKKLFRRRRKAKPAEPGYPMPGDPLG